MSDDPARLVLRDVEVGAADLPRVGGKGLNLARLRGYGQPVPPWYAVTTEAFRLALREAGLDGRIEARVREVADSEADAVSGAAAEIQGWIRDIELPAAVTSAIERAHARAIPASAFTAVRSSATAEDAATDSFAGLHDSVLFVPGLDGVLAAVRKVWASAYNERALAYRLARGISLERIAISALVQQMIDARVSGVMFTVNPNSGDVYEIVVSALYGAGEGLVSAGLDADTYIVDKETLEARIEIAAKSEQLVVDVESGGGLERIAVPDDDREVASLSAEQLQAVAAAGAKIERCFGRPQDVEFSLDDRGRLFILQARPVTTVEELGPAAGNRLIWDNSNIIESYSGVTTPMTFSFIRHAYTIVYHCFADVMGIRRGVVRRNRDTFANMLGLIRGQVYYNLRNWYRLIRLFPGYEYNKQFMESMMGVREAVGRDDEEDAPAPGLLRRYLVELPALARLALRSARNFMRIRKLVDRFERDFKRNYNRWSAMDFSAMRPHELRALYLEMEEKLLWNWKTPIINDFFVMIFYGTLKKLCASWCGDESGSLQNDLICGEGGIESTEPTRMLQRLAAQASQDPALKERLLTEPPQELAVDIPNDPRFTAFADSLRRYLDLYGFRCVNELKLEEHSLKDRPAFLYQVLRNYLSQEDGAALDADAGAQRESRVRLEAESVAFAALRGSRSLIPRRRILRWVLANARLGVKNRENMRFARTRIYGLLRELIRAIGARFAEEGILEERDDIFYLTLDEVWDFIKGTAVTTDLRGLVRLRCAEFDAYRSETEKMPDDRFETFGMVYHRNRFKSRRATVAATDGALQGTGCCPGVVTGPVKVLRSPTEDARLAGEILVAERTDPGWVPLYPSVSGILIERGSILSHSAIVAREMGIPTIVGIPGLTASLRTGQCVTMDGAAGTVRLVDDTPAIADRRS